MREQIWCLKTTRLAATANDRVQKGDVSVLNDVVKMVLSEFSDHQAVKALNNYQSINTRWDTLEKLAEGSQKASLRINELCVLLMNRNFSDMKLGAILPHKVHVC